MRWWVRGVALRQAQGPRKWENGKMRKRENGEMGKRGNGETGKWENEEEVMVVGRPFDRLRDRIVMLLWSWGEF